MKGNYFLTRDMKKTEDGMFRFEGKFIVDGDVAFMEASRPNSRSSSDTKKKPPYNIKPPKLHEVKWILPPKGSPAYGRVKEAAEAAGYETVEHDDFSYPSR